MLFWRLAKPFIGLVVAALCVLFSSWIRLSTALAATLVGIIETLLVPHRHIAKPVFLAEEFVQMSTCKKKETSLQCTVVVMI